MPSPMPNTFVWYDLMTPDLKAAETFYTSVAGWTATDSGLTDRAYTLVSVGSTMAAALMGTPDALKGAPPMWNGYIGVDNVDGFAERVVAAGGSLHRAPEDIPNGIGRFAVVADPAGASFILFKAGYVAPEPPPPLPPTTPGVFSWHELHAADGVAAWEFYSTLFGWTKGETVDMGPMGLYQTFAAGSHPIGGMMTKMPEMAASTWLYYVTVDSAAAAIVRITGGGGKVVSGPHQVPGGSWVAQASDPQGALFAINSMNA